MKRQPSGKLVPFSHPGQVKYHQGSIEGGKKGKEKAPTMCKGSSAFATNAAQKALHYILVL